MRARHRVWLAVLPLLCAPPAWAQETGLGLDLTADEAPAAAEPDPDPAPASLGLDLTEPSVELRPTLAIAQFELEEGALDSDAELATWLQTKLVDGATRSGAYARVISPEEVTQTLGTAAEALAVCTQADCLSEAADTLEVERLVLGKLLGSTHVVEPSTVDPGCAGRLAGLLAVQLPVQPRRRGDLPV